MADDKNRIEKFDGEDFGWWKLQIEDYLYQKDLQAPLLGEKPAVKKDETEATRDAAWAILDRKALGVIRLALTKKTGYHITKAKSTKEAMETLSNLYEKPSTHNQIFLLRKLVNMKLADRGSVVEHVNKFTQVTNQLESAGVSLENRLQALLFLCSLPDSYNTAVQGITSTCKDDLSLDDAVSTIMDEEMRRKASGGDASASQSTTALSVEKKGRGRQRGRSRGPAARSKSRGRYRDPAVDECWFCNKPGHRKVNCEEYKKKQQEERSGANVVCTDTQLTSLCLSAGVDTSADLWFVDSGASYHCTPSRDVFCDYVAGDFGSVTIGNGQKCLVKGKGTVTMRWHGQQLRLRDTMHIPDLSKNLISTSVLDGEGYATTFSGGEWKITRGSRVIARGARDGTLYTFRAENLVMAVTAPDEKASTLWHRRLGHLGEKGVKQLHSRNLLPGLQKVELDFCEDCVYGKQKAVSFKTQGRERKGEKLELVHSDVWGPAQEISYGGKRWYVTFIDDATRKVWVYGMQEKSEVFGVFKLWKAKVERESGCNIKALRSDNGGEYTSKEFEEFLKVHGIRAIRTVPKTPQENGTAERMNRTLLERARSMRLHAGLPLRLWMTVIATAAFLINRSPSSALEGGIPEELWSGKPVNYAYLKIYGCIAYALIDPADRKKLDAKSQKCAFVGYGEDSFGYVLWDYEHNRIIRSRNVVFDEDHCYGERSGSTSQEANEESTESESVELDAARTPEPVGGSADIPVPEPVDIREDDDDAVAGGDPEPVGEPALAEMPVEKSVPVLRRSTRERKQKVIFDPSVSIVHSCVLLTDAGEPESYREALASGSRSQWERAMKEEMTSLYKNQTWDLVPLPEGRKALLNKWVFRIKDEADGSKRFKARMVVKGFLQREGLDYNEIFSPVVKMTSVRVLLSIVAIKDLHLEQLDVKTAFLHGDLDEEIYMKQPEGFEIKGKTELVCRLKKSLYGLKQAPRQWYLKFDGFMQQKGFLRCETEHCLYYRKYANGDTIYLALYVDDMLVAGSSMQRIMEVKKLLGTQFEMKDLGAAKQILGMKITRDRGQRKLWLSQEDYIRKVLKRFNMEKSKPVACPLAGHMRLSKEMSPKSQEDIQSMAVIPYASAVGSLMYAMVCTRPDLAQAVGVVSRYMQNPGKEHWGAVKWIFRYLAGTADHCLCFSGDSLCVQGYVDADHSGDRDSGRSTTGYVFTVGKTAVSWISQLQKIVALSTTESEYVAITEASKEMIWLQRLMKELQLKSEVGTLWTDSQSAAHLAKNAAFHSRTKHIQLRYHFIRQVLDEKELKLEKIDGKKNPSDMLTKSVDRDKLRLCSTAIGLASR